MSKSKNKKNNTEENPAVSAGESMPKEEIQEIKEAVDFLSSIPESRKNDMLGYISSHEILSLHGGMSQSVRITSSLSSDLVKLIEKHSKGVDARTIAIQYLKDSL